MASLNPSHTEEMAHRLSVKIFDENMPHSNTLNPYYQQNPNLRILIINKFHHNNIIHHNRMLILITTRKSLPLVPDNVRPHFRQILINIRQVPNIVPTPSFSNAFPTQ
jgi:hypothetical protein